jgi:hypothetical protein
VDREEFEHGPEGARVKAKEAFQKDCEAPFREIVGADIPSVPVSGKRFDPLTCRLLIERHLVNEGYQETISQLIGVTVERVEKHVAGSVSIVTAIAQRGNPVVKVEKSIE